MALATRCCVDIGSATLATNAYFHQMSQKNKLRSHHINSDWTIWVGAIRDSSDNER